MVEDVTVVIPVGPADGAAPLLRQLATSLPGGEVIVSATRPATTDETAAAGGLAVRWVTGPAGRAVQQNRGAREARGRWLWFLHADSTLDEDVIPALTAFVSTDESRIGYFRLRFAADGPRAARLNAVLANVRSRRLGLPFGDQGLVLSRSAWIRLGGFDESVSLGEDLDLVVRARADRLELAELEASLTTSARRYAQSGWLRTTWRHLVLTWALYRAARRRVVQRAQARLSSPN